MFVVFVTYSRCNAQCAHCYSSCGPQLTDALPANKVRALMDEAAALTGDGPLQFSISGGEPFLEFDELVGLVRHAKSLGAWTSIVSNGFWASSAGKAEKLLGELKSAGLAALAISASRFHTPYVPQSRVRCALATAQAFGLHVTLKYVKSASGDDTDRALCDWAEDAGIDLVQRIPLMPDLRDGVDLPESEFPRFAGVPSGRCPAQVITVRESGDAYACCSPGAHTPWYRLGNVHEHSLEAIRAELRGNRRHYLLRQLGPAHIAEAVRAAGEGRRLRASYSGICDLCTHIAADPVMADIADRCAREHQLARLRQILKPLVQPETGA